MSRIKTRTVKISYKYPSARGDRCPGLGPLVLKLRNGRYEGTQTINKVRLGFSLEGKVIKITVIADEKFHMTRLGRYVSISNTLLKVDL